VGHKARYRPQRLAAKLRQIRQSLGLSQSQLARLISVGVTTARISEYENGVREPPLMVLLAYGYLVGISTDDLIDDGIDLPAQISIKKRRKRITLKST
jgi:transcriptional regulator with XRE-family HTH domain